MAGRQTVRARTKNSFLLGQKSESKTAGDSSGGFRMDTSYARPVRGGNSGIMLDRGFRAELAFGVDPEI